MRQTSCDKLNSFHLTGAICLAAIIAVLAGQWWLFLLVGGALVGASVFTGEIRLPRK